MGMLFIRSCMLIQSPHQYRTRGDGRIARDILPAAPGEHLGDISGAETPYQIEVYTGDIKYGGTNANVSLQVNWIE